MPGPRDEAHDPRVDEVAASFFQPPQSPPSATPTSATTMPLPVSFSLKTERPHHMSRPPGRVRASFVLTSLDPCGSAAVAAAAAVGGPAVLSRLTAEDGTWQNGSARRGSGLCSSGCLRRRRRSGASTCHAGVRLVGLAESEAAGVRVNQVNERSGRTAYGGSVSIKFRLARVRVAALFRTVSGGI
jgi:hypothetical protein